MCDGVLHNAGLGTQVSVTCQLPPDPPHTHTHTSLTNSCHHCLRPHNLWDPAMVSPYSDQGSGCPGGVRLRNLYLVYTPAKGSLFPPFSFRPSLGPTPNPRARMLTLNRVCLAFQSPPRLDPPVPPHLPLPISTLTCHQQCISTCSLLLCLRLPVPQLQCCVDRNMLGFEWIFCYFSVRHIETCPYLGRLVLCN